MIYAEILLYYGITVWNNIYNISYWIIFSSLPNAFIPLTCGGALSHFWCTSGSCCYISCIFELIIRAKGNGYSELKTRTVRTPLIALRMRLCAPLNETASFLVLLSLGYCLNCSPSRILRILGAKTEEQPKKCEKNPQKNSGAEEQKPFFCRCRGRFKSHDFCGGKNRWSQQYREKMTTIYFWKNKNKHFW